MNLTWQQSIGITQDHLIDYQQLNDQTDNQNFLIHQSITSDLKQLLLAAKNDGVEISIVSSYRSFERQLDIWNDKWQGYRPVFSRHGRPLNITQMADMEKYKAISLWSALPGLSRHHWGTDLDIFSADAIKQGHKVELTPEEFALKGVCCKLNDWLDKNLSKYGFFRPYQNYQQGVSAEAWHISHRATSQEILSNFPFEQCLEHLNQSDIKSRLFICDIFEHYKTQYFLNICD
jgi:LAS superfamily LD-carboxypeptidase LdcB